MIEVLISGNKRIYYLTPTQKSAIKDSLLVDNPAYASAKKYSKYKVVNVPKYLKYFTDTKEYLEVPQGYNIPYEHRVYDRRLRVDVKYPKFNLNLRKIQKLALDSYLDNTDKGLISLPTGSGKSILGLYIAKLLQQKTLVIVHKEDLVIGWKKDILLTFGDKVESGLIKAKSRTVGKQITIATIQTLSRLKEEEWEKLKDTFGLIIVDECHHAPASTYGVIPKFTAKFKVGLSATPERNDGLTKVMNLYLGDSAFIFKEGMVENKDVLPAKVMLYTLPLLTFDPLVIFKEGSFKLAEKGELKLPHTKHISEIPYSQRPRLSHHEVEDYVVTSYIYSKKVIRDIMKEFQKGRSILVFLTQKEHCKEYYNLLKEEGVPEETLQLFYGDSEDDTETLMKRAEDGTCKITIATLKKATEGTNVKAWEVVFLVSSMNNGMNVEQAVGRIRRAKKGKINPVLIYDYSLPNVYTFKNHINTRLERYHTLNFKIEGETPRVSTLFKRGFNSRV